MVVGDGVAGDVVEDATLAGKLLTETVLTEKALKKNTLAVK